MSACMENGNICRVTIAQLTPEPDDSPKWATPDSKIVADLSPRGDMASPTLPVVRFPYSHVNENAIAASTSLSRRRSDRNNHNHIRTVLPPSPNGVIVQNGKDVNAFRQRRDSLVLQSTENEFGDNDDNKKSKQLAKEIYEKYNMKSATHNMLPGKSRNVNGIEQYCMPWRNKTFLTLPLRFNGNINKKRNTNLTREKSYLSEINYALDSTDDLKFNSDWKDVMHW